jgi:hypothetical protein
MPISLSVAPSSSRFKNEITFCEMSSTSSGFLPLPFACDALIALKIDALEVLPPFTTPRIPALRVLLVVTPASPHA